MAAVGVTDIQRWPIDRDDDLWLVVATTEAIASSAHIAAATLGITKVLAILGVGTASTHPSEAQPVQATGTITFNDAGTADETITVDGIVYTQKAAPSAAYEIDIGGSATASAQELAKAINGLALGGGGVRVGAHPTVEASEDSGVVTITARIPGTVGNSIALAASDEVTSITLSGANLTGGADVAHSSASALPNTQTNSLTEDDDGDVYVEHDNGVVSQKIRVALLARRNS